MHGIKCHLFLHWGRRLVNNAVSLLCMLYWQKPAGSECQVSVLTRDCDGFWPTDNEQRRLDEIDRKLEMFLPVDDFPLIASMTPTNENSTCQVRHCWLKKKIPYRPRSVVRELIPCRPLSRRGWNPVKLAYKLAGWPAQLATSAFSQLSQYASNNNNNNRICIARVCRMTSEALKADIITHMQCCWSSPVQIQVNLSDIW